MRYDHLKDAVNAYLNRFGIVTESDEFEFRRWEAYYQACNELMNQGYWTWAMGNDTVTVSSNLATLPWEVKDYPLHVTPSAITNEQLDGRTLNYMIGVFNKIEETESENGLWIPMGQSSTASYTYTYKSIDATKKIVTVDEEITSAVATALAGLSVRFSLQPSWYKISSASAAAAGSATFTIDRAYTQPGSTSQTPESDALIQVEPPGCSVIRVSDSLTSVYAMYQKRFRPAVNDTDDCGWDARLDPFMPQMISGKILSFEGSSDSRERGYAIYGNAMTNIQTVLKNDIDGAGVTAKAFNDPDSGLGRRRTFTVGGMRGKMGRYQPSRWFRT